MGHRESGRAVLALEPALGLPGGIASTPHLGTGRWGGEGKQGLDPSASREHGEHIVSLPHTIHSPSLCEVLFYNLP